MLHQSVNRLPTAHLTREQVRLGLLVGLMGVFIGFMQLFILWQLDTNGFSIAGERLPYWDFSNLWGGSRLVLEGKLPLLFDVEGYRSGLNAVFNAQLPPQEWSYPPSILFIGIPLALLPIWLAYLIWQAGTVFLWHLAVRPFGLPLPAHIFVVLSPAVMSSLLFGQNGALTAALLIGGLTLAPKRPLLAGVLFGLLTIKPHLGFLVPLCLLLSWNLRAIAAAALTSILLVVATGLVFGFDVWTLFWTQTRPLMTAIMEAPYPQAYHTHAITGFIFARSLGLSVNAAQVFQLAVIMAAVAGVVWLWRPAMKIDHHKRVVLTGILAVIVLPYGYTHDSAPLYLAIVYFVLTSRKPNILMASVLWMFPILFPQMHSLGFSAGFIGPAIIAIWLFQLARQEQRQTSATPLHQLAERPL